MGSDETRALTEAEQALLRAAPIGCDIDFGNGDPHRAPRYKYQGGDGRIARRLWDRDFLVWSEVSPYGDAGGLLYVTDAGRRALAGATGEET